MNKKQVKSHRLWIRVSPDELKRWKKKAKSMKITVSDMIRDALNALYLAK